MIIGLKLGTIHQKLGTEHQNIWITERNSHNFASDNSELKQISSAFHPFLFSTLGFHRKSRRWADAHTHGRPVWITRRFTASRFCSPLLKYGVLCLIKDRPFLVSTLLTKISLFGRFFFYFFYRQLYSKILVLPLALIFLVSNYLSSFYQSFMLRPLSYVSLHL